MTAPAAPTLDATALARLRELDPDGRHGVLARVLGTFELSLAGMLQQLRDAGAALDATQLRDTAHKLKSSAASVGALELAACCADIERGVREGTLTDPPSALPPLLAEGDRALQAVRAMLGH